MQPDSTPLWRKLAPFGALAVIIAACHGIVMAQATNVVESVPPIVPDLSKLTQEEWLTLLISLVTPPVVSALAKLGVNPRLLPFTTPVIGVLLGVALNWSAQSGMSLWDMMRSGMGAIVVRALWRQSIGKTVNPEETAVLTPKAWDKIKVEKEDVAEAIKKAGGPEDAVVVKKSDEVP